MAARGAPALCIGRHAMSLKSTSRAFASLPTSPRIGFRGTAPTSSNSFRKLAPRDVAWGVRAASTVEKLALKMDPEREECPEKWTIKMLYDGDCPLCMREVNMLRERNKQYGTIKFVDISSADYSPEDNLGLDYQTVMGRIHAILADGTVVTDVEAFRRLYEQVGLGWVYAITKYEPIASVADAVYGVWAKYRLQLTGRPPLDEIMELRRKDQGEMCDDSSKCKM
ncbi:hypothetical protein MLD38_027944 [Melastoma candidum]|uniref:Uncharacterized protein n=1 Tax=Melastoma candidum TaxID=119954 RepID=A0ACB9N5K8_9MYRT|nr:hypothetical protein MLD38_027944 [Melastoma candidum]